MLEKRRPSQQWTPPPRRDETGRKTWHHVPVRRRRTSAQGNSLTLPLSISWIRRAISAFQAASTPSSTSSSRLSIKDPANEARASGGSSRASRRISAASRFKHKLYTTRRTASLLVWTIWFPVRELAGPAKHRGFPHGGLGCSATAALWRERGPDLVDENGVQQHGRRMDLKVSFCQGRISRNQSSLEGDSSKSLARKRFHRAVRMCRERPKAEGYSGAGERAGAWVSCRFSDRAARRASTHTRAAR